MQSKTLAKSKKIIKVLSAVLVAMILSTTTLYAASLGFNHKIFAGKFVTTKTPGVTCTSQYGAITVNPIVGPAGPFIIKKTSWTVRSGGWIMGFYNPTKDTKTCKTDTEPPAVVPVNSIEDPFGTSN